MSIMHNPKTAAFNAAIADMAREFDYDPDALATEAIAIQRDYHYSNSDMGMGEGIGYGPDDSEGPRNSAWNSIRAELNDPRIRAGKAILAAIGTEYDVHTFIGADRDCIELRVIEKHSSSDSISARLNSARAAYAEAIRIAGEKQMAHDLMVKKYRVRRTQNSDITAAANSLARANRMVSAFHSKVNGLEREFAYGRNFHKGAEFWEEFTTEKTLATIHHAAAVSAEELNSAMRNIVTVTIPEAGHEIPARRNSKVRQFNGNYGARQFHWEYPTETRYVENETRAEEKAMEDQAKVIARAAIDAMRASDEKAEKDAAKKARRAAHAREIRAAKKNNGAEIAGARMANSLARK